MEPLANRPKARILGTGHYLPEKVVTNFDLEKIVDTSDQWIFERTGIRQRHVAAEGELTSDMAAAAARRAIERAGITAEDVDLLVLGTVTGDVHMPSTAAYTTAKIGAKNAACFDISAACSGFLHGLSVAEKFVALGEARYAVVIGVEMLSRFLNWDDRSTCVLFGDAAGAVVIGPAENDDRCVLATRIWADGERAGALTIMGGGTRHPVRADGLDESLHYVDMVGREIFKEAVRNLTDACKDILNRTGLSADEIDWVVPHQANLRIIDVVARRLGVPMEKWCLNIERTANTSSASIPVALDQFRDRFKPGDKLLLCALGAGLNWGSAVVRW